jgi:hypothetical protein
MPFTPGRDTGNFPHISLKALNEKIDDPLKPYLEMGLKTVLKSLTRFSVPMFHPYGGDDLNIETASSNTFKGM